MKYIAAIALCVVLAGCATSSNSFSIWAGDPRNVLMQYPLDTLDKQAVFEKHGPASREIKSPDGRDAWVYEVGEGYGLRTYTIVFNADGIAVDVWYNDKGPRNGIKARFLQGL